MLVYPTERATTLLPTLREVGRLWNAAITVGFTPEETAQFEDLLSRAMENARRAVDKEVQG